MIDAKPSATALSVAFSRAQHRALDDRPWVLDDPFARLLIGDRWRRMDEAGRRIYTPRMQAGARAAICARSRYAEDRIDSGDFTQVILLGAGFDSLVWRRPDLLRRARIIEIDHPASQAFKRRRAHEIGLAEPDGVVYAAVDFEKETLADAFMRIGVDREALTFVIWLGVTMYLTAPAINETMKAVAGLAPGAEMALSWMPPSGALCPDDQDLRQRFIDMATRAGEPPLTDFTVQSLSELCGRNGLDLIESPPPEEIALRYFSGRRDGLSPYGMERVSIVRAVTASGR